MFILSYLIKKKKKCFFKIIGNYAVRHRDGELMKEVQKNHQEIVRLRKYLARKQAGLNPPPIETKPIEETENISILKFP